MLNTVSDLVMAWGRGWAASRGVPAPVGVPGGWRAEVGLPGHRLRHVLHTWDTGRLTTLDRQADRPGAWVKVVGDRAALRAALPSRWAMAEDGFLMTAGFRPRAEPAPAGYQITVTTEDTLLTAVARDSGGNRAAAAHLGRAGSFGVPDRVETEPGHRRRGLGTVLMTTLGEHAVRLGMTTGVLVATDAGQHLYRTLGWETVAPIAAAFLPED
ncbi:GNAT family N-acetyltransferase [Actinoplanes flavus]|uniref:GNAT family N-acetyltransferase n=1 Tax=Actinoplanes flavus TaxID=2820290 RepID=A0ABS3UYP7_9ACTN|nr:GNAT family N-acetyltransferase [Actinoplanes flavus]MBO3743661.1 GNAT family N-acetyltransferase [Actinoplanes flavus]